MADIARPSIVDGDESGVRTGNISTTVHVSKLWYTVDIGNSTSAPVEHNEQSITDVINLFVPPILIIVGITFNVLVILVMHTNHFRSMSTSVFLKAGACNDALGLLISLLAHWLFVNFPRIYVRTDLSHVMCKFFNFYGPVNTDLGIIFTASMTTERAVVIASPLGAGKYSSSKRAWIVLGIVTGFVFLKNVHFLISSDMVPEGRSDRLCDVFPVSDAYHEFWTNIWPWMNLAYLIVCGVTILASNCVILHNVRQSAADKHNGGKRWRQLGPMLLGESFLLIFLTFPFAIHLALLSIRLKYDPELYTNPETAARENLVFSITFYMLYSNKCANFVMYCITGSRFRQGLRMVAMTCFGRRKDWRRKMRSTLYMSTVSPSHGHKSANAPPDSKHHYDSDNSLDSAATAPSGEETEKKEETIPSVSFYI